MSGTDHVVPFLRYAVGRQEFLGFDGLTMDIVDGLSGSDFELFCAYALLSQGFFDIQQTPAVGDYGVDIKARNGNIMYAVQCKRHRDPVGGKSVQEVFAGCVHYHCDRAMAMTSSVFTKGAVILARETGVELFDRHNIELLLQGY